MKTLRQRQRKIVRNKNKRNSYIVHFLNSDGSIKSQSIQGRTLIKIIYDPSRTKFEVNPTFPRLMNDQWTVTLKDV